MRDTLRVVRERCVGLHECNLMPVRQLLGQARGGEAEVHALSVAINCSSGTDFRESMTSTLIESYGLKCTPPLGTALPSSSFHLNLTVQWPGECVGCGECVQVQWYTVSEQSRERVWRPWRWGAPRA